MIKADITTEITPIIGTEKQCEELVQYMLREFEDNPQKSGNQKYLVNRCMTSVVRGSRTNYHPLPENAQVKLQETLQRIVTEGYGGLICIII